MCNNKSLVIALVCTWLISFNAMAATVEFHESEPTPRVMDIYNLVGEAQDLDNVGDATSDGSDNDATTYVAPDRAAQGQTFLTASDSDTYRMTGFWVQHCGYTDNSDATWYYMPADSELVIRVVDMSDDAEDFVLSEESYTLTGEESIVYGGSQSMPLSYDNEDSDMVATAVRTLDGEDWTQGGAETLTLFFLGDRGNEGGELYVVVNSKKVTCDSDLNLGVWKQWNIDFADLGITPTNVTSLTIGIDGVGQGTVYIDEIRLYREAPVVAEPVDPGNSGLVLWYAMEESLSDSSGSNLTGTSDYDLYYDESLSEGSLNLGSALIFNGTDQYIDVPVEELLPTLTDSTYSIWFNIESDSEGSYMRAFDFGDDTTNYMFLCVRTGTTGGPEFALLSPDSDSEAEQDIVGSSALSEGWHHLAAVISGTTMSLYADGVLLESDETDTLPADLGATANNWLGQSQWDDDSLYEGLLDEFRIYNRALSEGEVRYLAGDR